MSKIVEFKDVSIGNTSVDISVRDKPNRPIKNDVIWVDGERVKPKDKDVYIGALEKKLGALISKDKLALAAFLWRELPEFISVVPNVDLDISRRSTSFSQLQATAFDKIFELFDGEQDKIKGAIGRLQAKLDARPDKVIQSYADICANRNGELCEGVNTAVSDIEFHIQRLKLASSEAVVGATVQEIDAQIERVERQFELLYRDRAGFQEEYRQQVIPAIHSIHIKSCEDALVLIGDRLGVMDQSRNKEEYEGLLATQTALTDRLGELRRK